jgi:hypothetical protein
VGTVPPTVTFILGGTAESGLSWLRLRAWHFRTCTKIKMKVFTAMLKARKKRGLDFTGECQMASDIFTMFNTLLAG